jgi:rSAM/selenodomain-associated transferase 2
VTAAPQFSFVIPVLNEGPRIKGLLEALSAAFPRAERIVVDGGSVDDSVAQALPGATALLMTAVGRAAQMNLGAQTARGEYLLFLHADTYPLFAGDALSTALSARPAWGFFAVCLDGRRAVFRVIERAISWRSRASGIGTGDQLLFVRRDVFEAAGGYAAIPLMEDVELSARLRRQHRPLVPPGLRVQTASRRWEQRGVARTVLQMWRLRLAFALGVSPERLWRQYYGAPR